MVKRAASAKPKKNEKLEPIEEVWKDLYDFTVMMMDTQVKVSSRDDNVGSIWVEAVKMWGGNPFQGVDPWTVGELMDVRQATVEIHEKMLEEFKKCTMDDFMHIEVRDIFADIKPKLVDGMSPKEGFKVLVVLSCIKTYADKLIQTHQLMLDEMKKRDIEPTPLEEK